MVAATFLTQAALPPCPSLLPCPTVPPLHPPPTPPALLLATPAPPGRYIPSQEVPDAIKALVENCWAADPEERPEFNQVVVELEAIAKDLVPTITEPPKAEGCCSLQ